MQDSTEEANARKRYLLKFCEILMRYGTPSYRLERLMSTIAADLKVDCQFYYLPQCMLISFNAQEQNQSTAELKLVRVPERYINLGKMWDACETNGRLLRNRISLLRATDELEAMKKKPKNFSNLSVILAFGLASLSLGPFAFVGQWADLPIAFLLGCLLGALKRQWAPTSTVYNNVFELVAISVIGFLSRWIGSVAHHSLFCFSSLVQSSIALILPGYAVVIAALEVQSRFVLVGATRLTFSMLYSLTATFSITIGIALYGLLDHNASSDPTCWKPVPEAYSFIFVPLFTLAIMVINQANRAQMFEMTFIACAGYMVYWSLGKRLGAAPLLPSSIAGLVIAFLANALASFSLTRWIRKLRRVVLQQVWKPRQAKTEAQAGDEDARTYSVFRHKLRTVAKKIEDIIFTKCKEEGLDEDLDSDDGSSLSTWRQRATGWQHTLRAAVLMIPAILVQVPSGISATGALVSGIEAANELTGNRTDLTAPPSANEIVEGIVYTNMSATVGYSMVQIAVCLMAGLYMGDALWYFVCSGLDKCVYRHHHHPEAHARGAMFSL